MVGVEWLCVFEVGWNVSVSDVVDVEVMDVLILCEVLMIVKLFGGVFGVFVVVK